MKQMEWKIPAILTIGMLFSSSVLADYSKGFDGYRIFETNCSVCHGSDGTGNGPLASKLKDTPSDLTDNDALGKISDRQLFQMIEGTAPHGYGDKDTDDMPKWGLAISHTQINSLVAYIRYLHTTKHPASGNPLMGKQVYDNNCTICHGSNGKGKGALTKVFDMEPADHTDASSMNKISNEKMHSVISNGATGAKLMPGWKDTLSDKEIEDVISYIRLLSAQ
jgi:cbb3-type cytochrome c oxidase subunit III